MRVTITQALLATLILTQVPGMLRVANKYQSSSEASEACRNWEQDAPTELDKRPYLRFPEQVPTENRKCHFERSTQQWLGELDGEVTKRYRF